MTKNKLTGERFNVWDIDGTIFLEDHEKGSYHIGETGNVDINCLNDIANRLNDLTEENEQLKQQMQRLYNYFADWFDGRVLPSDFSEMWDFVKEDEKWD